MAEGLVTLFAVALAGEESYWLCQPVSGKALTSDWKNCTCRWLYPVKNTETCSSIPWYKDDLGLLLELDMNATSRISHFAVVSDSVKATKFIFPEKGASKTYFVVDNGEKTVLDAKFDEFLRREEVSLPQNHARVVEGDRIENSSISKHEGKTTEDIPFESRSAVSETENDGDGVGNSEVFLWEKLYILEYGNRIFYVCPSDNGNQSGYKVERLVRKGVTLFLLFHDKNASPTKINTTEKGTAVDANSVLDGIDGKVLVMMVGAHKAASKAEVRETVFKTSRAPMEVVSSTPPLKNERKETRKQQEPSPVVEMPSLKAVSVNLWMECNGNHHQIMHLAESFPFVSDGRAQVRTTVFPDGSCVTYDSVTAAKYAGKKKGLSLPADSDMIGLLENIHLAKEQFKAM